MEGGVSFRPIETVKSSVAIYDQIQKMIVDGVLKPGDRLPSERTMVNMFQKSRPSIREALRMLENDGMIQVVPGGGATVTMPDVSMLQKPLESLVAMRSIPIEDLIEYRKLTEIAVVSWAAQRRTEENLQNMACCLDRAAEILDSDADRFFAEDVNFHILVCESSDNLLAPILGKILHNLVGEVLMTGFEKRNPTQRRAMCEEIVNVHRRIDEAIPDRDVERAQNAMKVHLDNFSHAKAYYPGKKESL